MKKTFTILIAAIAAILMMAQPMKVMGQSSQSYNFTLSAQKQEWTDESAIGSGTLKYDDGENSIFTYTSGDGDASAGPKVYDTKVHFYAKKDNNGNGNWMTIAVPANTTITGVELTALSSYTPPVKYNVDGGSDVSWSASNNKYTLTNLSASSSFKFRNAKTGNTNTQLRISAIKITYITSGGGQQLTPTTTTITAPQNFNDDLYVGTTAGTLTAAVTVTASGNAISGATVIWASSDESVATVDNNGAVTLVAVGTTNITATYAGDQTYATSSDTYQLTVVDNTPSTGTDVTFVAGTDTGATSVTKDGITVSMSTMSRTDNYRCYANSDMTVTSVAGKTITKVVLTCVSGNGANNFAIPTGSPGTYSYSQNNLTGTWTGSTSTVTLHASSQVRITQIVVTYETDNTPTISANPSTLNTFSYLSTSTDPSAAQSVAVTGANLTDDITASVGANSVFEISTAENGTYTNSLTLDESNGEVSTTIWVRMKANQTGNPTGTLTLSSTNASVTIDLNGSVVTPMSVADAIDAIDNASNNQVSGAYVLGIISEVVSYQSNYNSITYWISDDGESNELQVYSGLGLNGAPFSALTDLSVGDEVVVYGDLKIHINVYEFNYNSQIVSLTPHQAQDYTLEVTSVSNAEIIVFDATDPDETNWVNLFDGVDEAEVTEGTPIALSVSAVEGYALSELMVNGDNHVADIDGGVYTFNMPAQSVTITVTAVPVYNITYSENGVETQAQVLSTTLTLPTADDLDSEFAFAGWTTTPGNFVTPTAAGTQVNIQGGETFYAVYARIEGREAYFEKVTEDLQDWSGNYLIVAVGEYADHTAYSVAFNGSLEALDVANNHIEIEIDENDRIEYDAEGTGNSYFTIAPIVENNETTGWSIQSASGYYVGRTSNSNGMQISDETAYSHSLSIDGNGNAVITSSGNPALRYNKASDQKRFRYYTNNGQQPIQLYKEVVSLSTTSYYTRVFLNETASSAITISGPSIIPSENHLNMNGNSLTSATAANLIIEDGGQLVLKNTNDNVKATFHKNLEAWDDENDEGWYTISSPIDGVSTGTLTEDCSYNLYQYNEPSAHWWGNGGEHAFTTLAKGVGYLYRRNNEATVSFSGTVNVGSYNTTLTCTSTLADNIKGFHLIGNPFAENISSTNIALSNNDEFTGGYVLTKAGSWEGTLQTTIKPCEGFLIQVAAERTITISKTAKGTSYNRDYIKFIVANSQYEDVTFALFEKAHGLSKIDHRNSNVPMLYIPQNDQNYAIAPMSDNTKSFNLSFKAMTTGKYTLRYDSEGEYNYLHIIDRLTGADVDMLLEGEYSFIGTPNDNENRFIVNLEYMPNYSEGNKEIFAFQSGDEILVSGSGELQIFDVTGRSVMTTIINGAESINLSAKGVYIFRLVGSEIKTQKIVVR